MRIAASAILGLIAVLPPAAHAAAADAPLVEVLSNRADLVSGGDALVRIVLPARAAGWTPRVLLRGRRDITADLDRPSPRVLQGLVTGLRNGPNLLQVRLRDRTGAALMITNHPQGGPVFAGPQIQPWICQETAVDRQCNQPPEYTYMYRSSNPIVAAFGLLDYDPKSPPDDVATTRTESGAVVPFIVRVETGYVDRDQYKIATLARPGRTWSALDPPASFAHKLLITHGASCDITYGVGTAPGVTKDSPVPFGLTFLGDDIGGQALGKGYVVMSTAADNSGHNCNLPTQAESLVMAKERVIERYGTLEYTIGSGCSGGSLAIQWIANAYPGIYDGILPTCSFPDTWSSATQVFDYHILRHYFEDTSRWIGPDALNTYQWSAIYGSPSPLNAIISDLGFFNAIVADRECKPLPQDQVYSPKNPSGVRCSVADFNINIFGPRDPANWSAVEKRLGHGFASVPVDNVGVQYGLDALRRGQISAQQFVNLNAEVGSVDVDGNPAPNRLAAEPFALAAAYRSGSINETNNMGSTPIIDCRGPDPGLAHDSYRAYAVRARLDRALGHHDNQVIYGGPTVMIADLRCNGRAFAAMTRWLDAIAADRRDVPRETKVREDRPADVRDQCLDGQGNRWAWGRCPDEMVPVYGTPRTVAGDAITTDANKCALKEMRREDYPVTFSAAQWARLVKTFPDGVCDYARPPVGRQPTVPWLAYADARGRVVYGGRPLGPAPRSIALGVPRPSDR